MYKPTLHRVLAAGLAILAVGAFGPHARGLAAPQNAAAIAALEARARQAGHVRVIVGQRTSYQFEDRLAGPVAVQAQRDRVADTTRQILAGVPSGIDHVKAFITVPFFAATVDAGALSALAASPQVASIVEDIARPVTLNQSGPLIGAPQAWSAGYTGSGWSVAILDTGVDAWHPFLSGKVVAEACYSTTDTTGTSSSKSLCPGGAESTSSVGSAAPCTGAVDCDHGTHVAGIAAGRGDVFSGIGRDATIIAIKVFSQFSSTECGGAPTCVLAWDSDVVTALDHVYALRATFNIAAVNLSLGSGVYSTSCDGTSPAMTTVVDQLRSAGIATIASAGNAAASNGLSFPACVSHVVSVGASTKSDVLAGFSNTGPQLSLLAPGEYILSSTPDGNYAYKSGTSMAAPHVTGSWALLKQRKPNAGVDEILGALRSTGVPIVDTRVVDGPSYPRIRVDAAASALVVPEPYMALDTPAGGTLAAPFAVAGWAIDRAATSGTGIDAVHVWAFPASGASPSFLGVATLGQRRDDVASVFGSQFVNAGYWLDVPALAPGSYVLVAYAHSAVSNSFSVSRSVTIVVPASWPQMSIDTPGNGSTVGQSFVVSGWAIDRVDANGPGVDAVHVWAFPVSGGPPVFLGVASYGGSRPDVAAAFGPQFTSSAYYLSATLPPGVYDISVYAHSAITGTFNQSQAVRVGVQ